MHGTSKGVGRKKAFKKKCARPSMRAQIRDLTILLAFSYESRLMAWSEAKGICNGDWADTRLL
jgi:hypothetical protein